MEPSGAAWQQTSFESAGVAEFVTEFATELVTWRNMRRQFQIAAFPRKKFWHHVDINQRFLIETKIPQLFLASGYVLG